MIGCLLLNESPWQLIFLNIKADFLKDVKLTQG